jgi:hypothetical protein
VGGGGASLTASRSSRPMRCTAASGTSAETKPAATAPGVSANLRGARARDRALGGGRGGCCGGAGRRGTNPAPNTLTPRRYPRPIAMTPSPNSNATLPGVPRRSAHARRGGAGQGGAGRGGRTPSERRCDPPPPRRRPRPRAQPPPAPEPARPLRPRLLCSRRASAARAQPAPPRPLLPRPRLLARQ